MERSSRLEIPRRKNKTHEARPHRHEHRRHHSSVVVHVANNYPLSFLNLFHFAIQLSMRYDLTSPVSFEVP